MTTAESIIEFFKTPEINQFLQNKFVFYFIHFSAITLLNLISYSYIGVKFYKVLCYSKMTFDWLPMINHYIWPFSFFSVLTTPYFKLWRKILPAIQFENSSMDISGILALEALNSLIYFCVRFTNFLILILVEIEDTIHLS